MYYIFVTGGVMSSIGKGMIASSVGYLLKSQGYKIRVRKIEPYLNVDAGTLNPFQHGEVFVTNDGAETDLDVGNYERFTDINAKADDVITNGKIYLNLIQKERKGDLLGQTIQVVPHIINMINEYIQTYEDEDFLIYEVGGTVGDLESMHFLEAISTMQYKAKCLFIHVGWIPYISSSKEHKTKPIQHSIKELRKMGINPNIIVCRSETLLDEQFLDKIACTSNISRHHLFSLPNVENTYKIPILCNNMIPAIEHHFHLASKLSNIEVWQNLSNKLEHRSQDRLRIALVGKYSEIIDSYKSIIEALQHASIEVNHMLEIIHVDSEHHTNIDHIDGILVPGGFGVRETENMIHYIHMARIRKIPYFGICFGMHLAIIEYCRNVLNIYNASSEEFELDNTIYVIAKHAKAKELGGTMRLGAIECKIHNNTILKSIYKSDTMVERHRHRYDVTQEIQARLGEYGMIISAKCHDIVEAIELSTDQWFIAVQYHPELLSRPHKPHPLFVSFLHAAKTFHNIYREKRN